MKKCVKCGAENADGMKFCGNCGYPLPEDKPKAAVCGACGAKLAPDAVFCGKCGARISELSNIASVQQSVKCSRCGAELAPDSSFCLMCGTAVGKASANSAAKSIDPSVRPYAAVPVQKAPVQPKKKPSAKIAETRDKVLAFEKKNNIIVNVIVAVLALVFVLVSLLAPIKVEMADVSSVEEDSVVNETESTPVSQSVWQVLSAGSYLDLDMSDKGDVADITAIFQEYSVAFTATAVELQAYQQSHPYATQAELEEKYKEILADHMSDVNAYKFVFAFTTIGALDYLMGEEVEADMADMLIEMRDAALFSWVFALVTSILQLCIAALALVFLVLAIVGIVRKKPTKLFMFTTILAIASGVGLVLLMAAPLLFPSGAMFAMALTSVITLLVFGTVKAFLDKKNVAHIIKRIAFASIAIVAAFMLCSNVLKMRMIMQVDTRSETVGTSPLGGAFEGIIVCLDYLSLMGVNIVFSDLSMLSCIIALALGLASFVSLYTAMLLSLKKLAVNAECKRNFDVPMLISAILLICFAIVPAVVGAADDLPLTKSTEIAIQIVMTVRVFVYLAIAFSVAAFAFGLIFRPKLAAVATANTASETATPNAEMTEYSQNELGEAKIEEKPEPTVTNEPQAEIKEEKTEVGSETPVTAQLEAESVSTQTEQLAPTEEAADAAVEPEAPKAEEPQAEQKSEVPKPAKKQASTKAAATKSSSVKKPAAKKPITKVEKNKE